MTRKLGLDYHGILDKHSALFSDLTKVLYAYGWEIHVITGQHIDEEFLQQLKERGISYTHTFSIIDFHQEHGTDIHYNDRGPWIDADLWNKTKAEYCAINGIDLHIDDSDIYGDFFTTPYLQMKRLAVVEQSTVDLETLDSKPEVIDDVQRYYNELNPGL